MFEARRSGLPLIIIVAFSAGLGIAGFISQVALTENSNLQTGVLAACFRMIVVFLSATFVVTSMVRESSDKGLELMLSLPISRTTYYLGKLAGFAACGALLGAMVSFFMLFWSAPLSVAAWGTSLALEASLVCAISLFFVVALGQTVPAIAGVAGLYLLGRAISAVQAISVSPLAPDDGFLRQVATHGVNVVALLLPPLDRATQTEWLLYAPPSIGDLAGVAGMLCAYGALIVTAGLFDFHRRSL
jgi:hypothetical protein